MNFSLLYTTRRPQHIRAVIERWFSSARFPEDVEMIICVDADDEDGRKEAEVACHELREQSRNVRYVVQAELPGNCVKGWNRAAEFAEGHALIAISDDFFPPNHWDSQLMDLPVIGSQWLHGDYAVLVSDGLYNSICTLGIITRARYLRFGYFWYPYYESMFCDDDLTERAIIDEALIDARHLRFQHQHIDNGKREKDAVDAVHASDDRAATGRLLHGLRKARAFPIDAGPRASLYQPAADEPVNYAAFLLTIKDDFCLFETCQRLADEGVKAFFFGIPSEYWDGRPTPDEDQQAVIDIATKLAKANPTIYVDVWGCDVRSAREGAENRIHLETRIRNLMLERMRSRGYYHYLIVDGDELWRTGTLAKIDEVVRREAPPVITVRNVPVVGLPGYPVDDAKDRVTVYVRGDTSFRDCRAPYASTGTDLEDFALIHFSAVRKSSDEIVRKMRDSGHYDDPSYDFEGFIQNTLPNVHPGMENVHMYRDYQIWPSLRNWTAEELSDIPESIQPYLAK